MVQFGTWAEIPSPYVTDIMSKAGFDFSIIDMEHGVIDFETAQNMIFAAHNRNKKAYIRVPSIEEAWILRCLDMGCDGMIFPQVSGIDDIERVIQYSLFPPEGKRGFNPYITAGGYAAVGKDYFQKDNERIDLGIILEGKEGFQNLDKILKYNEISIIYIGQYDLSVALDIPGEVSNPKLLDIMFDAVNRIKKSGKSAGCMVHTITEAKEMMSKGFEFIVYKVDSGLLYQTVNEFVERANESN